MLVFHSMQFSIDCLYEQLSVRDITAMDFQVQAVQDGDAAAGAAAGSASVSVVQRLYDGLDRYVEDETTGVLLYSHLSIVTACHHRIAICSNSCSRCRYQVMQPADLDGNTSCVERR